MKDMKTTLASNLGSMKNTDFVFFFFTDFYFKVQSRIQNLLHLHTLYNRTSISTFEDYAAAVYVI